VALADAKAAIAVIQANLEPIVNSLNQTITQPCDAANASNPDQFETRAIRLQGFMMAHGAMHDQIDAVSAAMDLLWHDDRPLFLN
jgi:hypothetical protein